MKRVIYSILYCVAFLAITSCSEDITPETNTVNPGDITLSIFSAAPGTRAVVGEIPGVEALNENKINIVHYFFYPKNDTLSQPALIGRKGGYTEDDPALSAETEYSWTINVTDDKLKKTLFPMPYNSCNVYMIVNLPESISDAMEDNPDYDMSLPNLRRIALEANFDSTDPQASFVMEGLGAATIIDRKAILAAKGEIEVERVAAKISVNISVEDQLSPADGETTTNGLTWVSHPEDMEIELVNGVKTAVLGAIPTPVDKDNKFSTTPRRVTASNGAWSCAPFYSYPASWEVGAETEPYLRIRLPWTRVYTDANGETTSDGTPEYCIYKVILGGETLNRNTWYDLDIHIGILGGFENEPEVEIPLEDTHYFVADWSTGLSADASIEGARYLIVEKEKFKVYNEAEVLIHFTTSHKCAILNASCTHLVYDPQNKEYNEEEDTDYTLKLSDDGNSILFKNQLNNNMNSAGFDFTPYTTTFIIQHEDGKFPKEVTIIQYPAIYMEEFRNSDTNENGHGNVWVNGYNDNDTTPNSGQNYFGGAAGNSQGAYPAMYVFTISTTEGTNFIIGDPRDTEPTYTDADANWFIGRALYDGGQDRELKYYYGTTVASELYSENRTTAIYANDEAAEAAEPTINMIAPKFRLASGYGTVTETSVSNSLESMKKRCASYQEDGYPAGRWRLPTRAEFQFVLTQINLGNLPGVYLETYSYWCAHGLGNPSDGVVNMSYVSATSGGGGWGGMNITPVRCVYDEWYWENSETYRLGVDANGNYTPFNTFTWGDMPRENFK